MLIISHDRQFLNQVCDRTVFLRSDGAHSFKAPFSVAREELAKADVADAEKHKLEQQEIERLRIMAKRFNLWGMRNPDIHKRQKATEKRIEKMKQNRTSVYVKKERQLGVHDGNLDAPLALRIENHTVTTPDGARSLYHIDHLYLKTGDRAAILGVNGAGKTMLLESLTDVFSKQAAGEDSRRDVRFNQNVSLVYFDQRMKRMPEDKSILQFIEDSGIKDRTAAISTLAKAGFPYDRSTSRIRELSYGEKARLAFLQMKAHKPNFYLLDEPTNHLDIEGQEHLEMSLEETGVSCLFVSHDRFFTRAAANRFFEIQRGKLIEIESPDDFFERQVASVDPKVDSKAVSSAGKVQGKAPPKHKQASHRKP